MIRRFKKDIQHEVEGAFQDRRTYSREFPATEAEEAAYEALLAVQVASEGKGQSARDLFAVTLEKALFSSPAACRATIDQRLQRREREGASTASEKIAAEVRTLEALREKLEAIGSGDFAKYQGLLATLRGGADEALRWRPSTTEDRLVIFTERIETLNWLAANLAVDMKLRENQLEILHGGMSDLDQQRVVEDFGKPPSRCVCCCARTSPPKASTCTTTAIA